jgi:plastocyanin
MKPMSLPARVVGIAIALAGLALAACGPVTPNAGAETPFVPTNAAGSTQPAATLPPEGYPAVTPQQVLPDPTLPPESYPATTVPTQAPTIDPGAASSTPAPTEPPAPTATLAQVFITYRDFEIVPAQTTVKVGQTVNFIIESASGGFHQPYAGAAAPFIFEAPPNMGNGVSWPMTFNTAQTLTILCGYHGNMTATLIIEP